MNEKNLKTTESRLAKAYKNGTYKEDLERILEEKPSILKNIAYALENLFN